MSLHKPWADGPLTLMPTPEFVQNSNKSVDQFVKIASLMAVAHNVVVRGLNSIYIQAPHVKKGDYKDFIGYCLCWHQIIDNHHRSEEEHLFPQIEDLTGEKGIMDGNIAQHKSFEAGLTTYSTYLSSLAGHEQDFSPARLIAIIDSFSTVLHQHLSDEIPTLLDLSRFDSGKKKFPLLDVAETEFRRAGMRMNKTEGSMMFFLNLDATFEEGRWSGWPPVPWVIRWIMTRACTMWNSGWWKFASCDLDGNPKELYATGR